MLYTNYIKLGQLLFFTSELKRSFTLFIVNVIINITGIPRLSFITRILGININVCKFVGSCFMLGPFHLQFKCGYTAGRCQLQQITRINTALDQQQQKYQIRVK